MSTVKPIPDDMHTLTPHLVCTGAATAIDFYVKAPRIPRRESGGDASRNGQAMCGLIQC